MVTASAADAGFPDDEERRVALLVRIVAAALAVPDLDADCNFVEEGGHSLLAVALSERLLETVGLELELDVLYRGTLCEAAAAMRPVPSPVPGRT